MQTHAVTMLGTGLIGDFYTMTLHGQRGRDRVRPAGRQKLILKDPATGDFVDRVVAGA
jgi:hypothetical protein